MHVAIINCFDTYEQRVDLLYDFFCSKHDSVHIYTSNFRHFRKQKRKDTKKDYTFIEAIPYYKNMSVKRLYSHKRLSNDIFSQIEKDKTYDLIWILIPPNSFVKKGANYKKNHPNVKLIFDVIDMWPEAMPVKKFKSLPPIKIWKKMRDRFISYADLVVTECDLYKETLRKNVDASQLTTIYFAKNSIPQERTAILPSDKITLCYLGSINNIIDINAIQRIIKHFIKIKPVELNIIGDGEKSEELIESCKKTGAVVNNCGVIYEPSAKQEVFNKCHYGLNIMKDSVYVGLTMKSIDYFEAGLPIINNIKGDTWNLVDKYGLGININQLEKYGSHYQKEARENSRKFFEEHLSFTSFQNNMEKIYQYCNNSIN